jgi:hypothetical protein
VSADVPWLLLQWLLMLVQQHPCTVSVSMCSGCSVSYVWFPFSGCSVGRCVCLDGVCVRCFTGCSRGRWCVLWVADWELDAFAAGHVSFVTVILN